MSEPAPATRPRWRHQTARLLLLVLATQGVVACGDGPELDRSPINQKQIEAASPEVPYVVVLVGHPYGMYTQKERRLPAENLLASLPALEALAPRFYAFLGDNVRLPEEPYLSEFGARVAGAVDAPVFAIPGEHDLFEGLGNYERFFGPAYYRIRTGRELFVFLNSGKFETEISWGQLRFFERSLQIAAESPEIDNLVVLLHKVAWARLDRYATIREMINNDRQGELWSDIYPALREIAKQKAVFVGAGDVGHKSYSFLLDRNPDDGITYFATGMADRRSDTALRMDFDGHGGVAISPISLTAEPIAHQFTTLEGFAQSTTPDQPIAPTGEKRGAAATAH